MMQTQQFNVDGPVMSGTWKNFKTGDVFTVRDCFFEDNQLVVVTTKNQRYSYNQIKNYVQVPSQADNETQTQSNKPRIQGNQQAQQNNSLDAVSADEDLLTEEDKRMLGLNVHETPMNDLVQDLTDIKENTQKKEIQNSIESVLNKLSDSEIPKIKISLEWKNIPEGIMFLKKYLDISDDDLLKYIINKYISINDIKSSLEKNLKSKYKELLKQDIPEENNKKEVVKKVVVKKSIKK